MKKNIQDRIKRWLLGLQFLAFSLPLVAGQPSEGTMHPDTLYFTLTDANNMLFHVLLNTTDALDLFFDTGATELVLLHESIKNKTSLLDGLGSGRTQDFEPLVRSCFLKIGDITWDSLRVFPASHGPEEADGHFGWDLFKGKIVEINYDEQYMVVYDDPVNVPEGYERLPIEYSHTLFCITGELKIKNQRMTDRYLFDTGFQRALVLDRELRQEKGFPPSLPAIQETRLTNSTGEVFINRVVRIDRLCLGNLCLQELPAQLIETPNPARFNTHILGGELLKRFNTFLDFKNHYVYLKPNGLFLDDYANNRQ